MTREMTLTIPAHPSIYDGSSRELSVFFAQPEKGINTNTGIMVVITGYGEDAHPDALMAYRHKLADQYNVIALQCNYFGSAYMRGVQKPYFHIDPKILMKVLTPEHFNLVCQESKIDINALFNIGSAYPIHLSGFEYLAETDGDFNDMGLMQALDHLSAMFAVVAILKDNETEFNGKRVYVHGQGHGAFISILCNALAPGLFSGIVAERLELEPVYLKRNRSLQGRNGKLTFKITFDYRMKKLDYDKELMNLSHLYRRIFNQSPILVAVDDTKDEERYDLKQFVRSTRHASFTSLSPIEALKLRKNEILHSEHRNPVYEEGTWNVRSHEFTTNSNHYRISFDLGMPVLSRTINKAGDNFPSNPIMQ